MKAEEANQHARAGAEIAAAHEGMLRRQYRVALRGNARRTAASYRAKATVMTADVSEPHARPVLSEILDEAALAASAAARTRTTRMRIATAAAGALLPPDQGRAFFGPLIDQQGGVQGERLVTGAREQTKNVLSDSLAEGWSVDETAAALFKRLNLDAEWQSKMLARTDLVAISNGASQQSAQALGEDGPQYKTWMTAGDDAVRETHAEAEGQVVAIDQPFDVGGASLMYPGDPLGPDDEVINCRCASVFTDTNTVRLAHSAEGGIQEPALALAATAATVTGDEEVTMEAEMEFEDGLTAASFTADERKSLAKQGLAMSDGGYPIRNRGDLANAVQSFGRASNKADVKAWIIKRARALGAVSSLPKDWAVTASLVSDAGDLCGMLSAALMNAGSAVDAALTLVDALRASWDAEETAEGDSMYASANPLSEALEIQEEDNMTASAAGLAPIAAPSDWFEMPEPDAPTPLTITPEGQVFGHAAVWGSCHTGIAGRCTVPPRSRSGYDYFHLGVVDTADGKTVPVGKITLDTGHAPLVASRGATSAHYDHTGTQGAYVRAVDGEIGIWVSGALDPELPAGKVRALKAAALSGDWRSVNGVLELIGLLAVNVPGFPVPRTQALAASGETEEVVEALVAAGVLCECSEEPAVVEEATEETTSEAALPDNVVRMAATRAAVA